MGANATTDPAPLAAHPAHRPFQLAGVAGDARCIALVVTFADAECDSAAAGNGDDLATHRNADVATHVATDFAAVVSSLKHTVTAGDRVAVAPRMARSPYAGNHDPRTG